jgi:3-hydroxyisobutyrate dehydrogenase-like beta-hydroxyacid dehydrogenase
MGGAMARNLLAARYPVTAFDIAEERLAAIASQVIAGKGEGLWVKFPELPNFLAEAAEKGFPLPLTEALHAFLRTAEPRWRDKMNRPTVSFWHEVTTRAVADQER